MKCFVAILAIASLTMVFPLVGMSVSPVGYWTFNDENNPAKDDTGAGRDGRPSGPVLPVPSDAPVANPGFAMSFVQEPGNAIIIDNSVGLHPTDKATLMAWVNADDAAPTQFAAGFPYDDEPEWDNPWIGMQIGVRGGGMANWITLDGRAPAPGGREGGGPDGNDADWEFNTADGTVLSREWQHICMVFDGNDGVTAYVNGEVIQEEGGHTGAVGFNGTPLFIIGERSAHAPGEPFGGLIDEVAIYHAALSQDEIKDVMSNGADLSGVGTAVESVGKLTTTWGSIKDR
jgi:hypothetical protein